MKKKWIFLISSIIICQLAGIVGSLATFPAISTWYATLVKPSFNPPSWLFGPVWTILYTLMGTALYLVWLKGIKKNREAIIVFAGQLILNSLWSIIFFGMKNISLALVEILILVFFIILTVIKFHKVSQKAAYLLIPYLTWVLFASFLTYNIWLLNE